MVVRRFIPFLLFILSLVFAPGIATADDDETAKSEFMAGYAELERGNFRRALRHYQRSYRASPRPRTLYNIALCEDELGRTKDAIKHYQQFLIEAEKRDASFLADARQRLQHLEELVGGQVRILSEPPGALVAIDGQSKGHTPLVVKLAQGDHLLSLSHRFARGSERRIEVRAGKKSTEEFQLDPVGHVRIQVEPSDAVIRRMDVDDVTIGSFESALSPGKYRFEISLTGFFSKEVAIDVAAGTNTDRSIRLQQQSSTATLRLVSDVAGANVSVDGLIVGSTNLHRLERPSFEKRVTTGNHVVTVETRDGGHWRRRLHFSPGETLSVAIDFSGQSKERRWATKGLKGVGIGLAATGLLYGVLAVADIRDSDVGTRDRGRDRAFKADMLLALGGLSYAGGWYLGKEGPSAVLERSHEQEQRR